MPQSSSYCVTLVDYSFDFSFNLEDGGRYTSETQMAFYRTERPHFQGQSTVFIVCLLPIGVVKGCVYLCPRAKVVERWMAE